MSKTKFENQAFISYQLTYTKIGPQIIQKSDLGKKLGVCVCVRMNGCYISIVESMHSGYLKQN